MEYRTIGRSGLKVSEMGLGCGSTGFVGKADEATCLDIINRAVELGITYIDMSEASAEGRSETLVGKALNDKRAGVVIATKFGTHRIVGPNEQPGSRSCVIRSVENSLRRLNTDYIDLLTMHEPDPTTPIDETLRTLDDLVRSGKVRYIGCSMFAAWELCEGIWNSKIGNLQSFISIYLKYNLINRDIERDFVPLCQTYGVGIVPIAPQAGGFLTGKYQRGKKMPEGSRFGTVPPFVDTLHQNLHRYDKFLTDANFDKLAKLEAFVAERGRQIAELAIAWLLSRPWVGAVLVGVSSTEQLVENVSRLGWKLTEEDISQLEKII